MAALIFLFLFTNFAKDNLAGEISQNYCSNNETSKHAKRNPNKQTTTTKTVNQQQSLTSNAVSGLLICHFMQALLKVCGTAGSYTVKVRFK